MSVKPFHMGWFMEFSPDEWNGPFGGGGSPWNGEFYVEMAQALERACFDLIMAADTLMVSEAYGGSMETYLKHALLVPQHDPAPLAALMASATSRLGIAITLSTMGYPPFLLARLCRTLDHISPDGSPGTSSQLRRIMRRRISGWISCRTVSFVTIRQMSTWTWFANSSIHGNRTQ